MTGKGRGRGNKNRDATAAAPTGPGAPGASRGPSSYAQMGGGPAAAPQPATARAPAATAWGPPPGASSRATHRPQATSQPGDLPAQMQQMGLGGRPAAQPAPSGNGNGNGGHAPVGRGAMRGGRQIDIPDRAPKTRPDHLKTKKGQVVGKAAKMRFMANYFQINTVPDWVLHQYRVDISPEEDHTSTRRYLLRTHKDKLGGYLFDGTVLYTAERLVTPQNPQMTLTATSDQREGVVFTITIRHVGQVDYGDYAYIQVYNLLLRSCINALDLQLVGRDYYDAKAKIEVPEFGLELWPGYKTSIRQHEASILMCCEITFKVMRTETVYDILRNCMQQGSDYQRNFSREVVGCIVLTKYNNKTYRVDDVNWTMTPGHKFKFRDEEITFAEYMRRKYNITIKDLKQPLLVSKAKARDVRAGMTEIINLIPEVCHCTGLTDAMRENFRLMSALAIHTRVNPQQRIQKLMQFNQRLLAEKRAVDKLAEFKMTLDKNLVTMDCRVEETENIIWGGNKILGAGPRVDWTNGFRNSSLLNVKHLERWVVLVSGRDKANAQSFIQCLMKTAAPMRFNIQNPQLVELRSGNAAEYPQELNKVMDTCQPQLIMCVVGGKRVDVYSAIKKKCCVDRAVPTQVMQARNLNSKGQQSIATKVAVQICCKIGGSPWSVSIPLPDLMVVGFDVCHDTTDKNKSYGAMVASLDKHMSRYFSAVTAHTSGQELSTNLALTMTQAVIKYKEVNGGKLPARIIVYRDGVGEGQIPFVFSTELECLKAALNQVYGGQEVKMAYIIVTKRINTKIFTHLGANPPPGSIIDDVITDPEKYDFFLVSQSVNQGTVNPTSYNVIYDSLNLPAERLQRLTYKMCHLYFNWSGTVRVPAPCQYAHKLAFLVGQAIHRAPQRGLEDLLYFL